MSLVIAVVVVIVVLTLLFVGFWTNRQVFFAAKKLLQSFFRNLMDLEIAKTRESCSNAMWAFKNQFTEQLRLTDLVFQMGTFASLQGEDAKIASQSQPESHSLDYTRCSFDRQANHQIGWSACGVVLNCSPINSRP